jgi:phosphatidylserine decarboxylase
VLSIRRRRNTAARLTVETPGGGSELPEWNSCSGTECRRAPNTRYTSSGSSGERHRYSLCRFAREGRWKLGRTNQTGLTGYRPCAGAVKLGPRARPIPKLRMAFREALKFGTPPLAGGIVAGSFGWTWLAAILIAAAVFVFFFFRDPERAVPADPAAVVSPADGRVLEVIDEPFDGRPGRRVSIFLSLWDVHVNRAPVAGQIAQVEYRPGKFHAAMQERARRENEQNVIRLETARGPVVVKQIAGLIARRVLLWKQQGSSIERGERLGMIRFGSRVEMWLPGEAQVRVRPGEHVRGGASVVAEWR